MNPMTQQEIAEKLKAIIEPYVQDKEAFKNINEQTNLLADLKINSANLVDIIIDAEMAFDIEINDEEAEKMMVVKDAIQIIDNLLAE